MPEISQCDPATETTLTQEKPGNIMVERFQPGAGLQKRYGEQVTDESGNSRKGRNRGLCSWDTENSFLEQND